LQWQLCLLVYPDTVWLAALRCYLDYVGLSAGNRFLPKRFDRQGIGRPVYLPTQLEYEAVIEVAGNKTPIRKVYLERLVRQDSTGIWTVVGYDPAE
jgi:hypothetical protein